MDQLEGVVIIIILVIGAIAYNAIDKSSKDTIRTIQQTAADKQQRLHDMDTLSLIDFAEKIMEMWVKEGGRPEKLAESNGRFIFQVAHQDKKHIAVVCKAYEPVSAADLKGLYSVMIERGYSNSYYYTNETYTHPAISYAAEKGIILFDQNGLDNWSLSTKIDWVTKKEELLAIQEKLCPVCNQPMLIRKATKGPDIGKDFYVCSNYKTCRQAIAVRAAVRVEG